MLLALWVAVAHGACPTPTNTADLVSALDDAKEAYGNLEVEAFRAAMGRVHERLPCLEEEVTRHLAAELHRFEGLLGFLDRDSDRSQRAFASARAIEPNYKFPASLVPEGNPALAAYTALAPDKGTVVRVADPLQGRLLFDGATGKMRPTTFPTVFQRMDAEGAVMETAYLWPGDALPPYPARSVPVDLVGGEPDPTKPVPDLVGAVRAGPNKGLLAGAGATALASGLLYGSAFLVHQRYNNLETDVSKLDGLRRVNNGFVLASGATLATAVGLGTSAFLTGRF